MPYTASTQNYHVIIDKQTLKKEETSLECHKV